MYIIFPGQGSQKSKMGINNVAFSSNKLVAKNIIIAQEITKKDIKYLIEEADAEELNKTENAQIAIFVLSYSLFLLAQENNKISKIKAAAGHSLGEYTALCAADVLSFEDTCILIKERASLMQEIRGSMLACLNINPFEADMIALLASDIAKQELCFVANYNSATQIVLSGNENAIKNAKEISEKLNKRAIILPTSGPFHTPYMLQAAQKLEKTIDQLKFNQGNFPVISNIYAKSINWEAEGAQTMKKHMIAPVRWQESMELMNDDKIIEIGATSLLMNMAKRDGYDIEYCQEYL